MADQTPKPEESWLIVRLFRLLAQYPFIAISVWMAHSQVQDGKIKEKDKVQAELKQIKQDRKDSIREAFDKEQLVFYRDIKLEIDIKRKELNIKYEKDSIKNK